MADPMAELEAEMKKQREARAAELRLKAQEQALSGLSAPQQNQRQPASEVASSSSASPKKHVESTVAAGSNPTGAYIPPSWATAGQEQDLLPQARQEAYNPGAVIETESISLGMCGCGGPGGGAGTQFFAMAGLHPPSDASFEAHFREWFDRDYFPIMNEDLKRELVHRAKSKGFFSGLSSQVKKWAMANTDARLQSDVWCSYFLQNAPPKFRTVGCVKMASINVGSQAAPCWIPFVGFPESETQRLSAGGTGAEGAKWILPPFCRGTADISALMDELDGRGGMTALLSAAA
jgi:hypothetical protein